jgi:hypothetical protein
VKSARLAWCSRPGQPGPLWPTYPCISTPPAVLRQPPAPPNTASIPNPHHAAMTQQTWCASSAHAASSIIAVSAPGRTESPTLRAKEARFQQNRRVRAEFGRSAERRSGCVVAREGVRRASRGFVRGCFAPGRSSAASGRPGVISPLRLVVGGRQRRFWQEGRVHVNRLPVQRNWEVVAWSAGRSQDVVGHLSARFCPRTFVRGVRQAWREAGGRGRWRRGTNAACQLSRAAYRFLERDTVSRLHPVLFRRLR